MPATTKSYIDIIDRPGFTRAFEILPGVLTWTFLLSPILLSLLAPIWVAYFIIAFDLIWLIKSMRLSYFLIRGYTRLHNDQRIDWRKRLSDLRNLPAAQRKQEKALVEYASRYPASKYYVQFSRTGWARRHEYLSRVRHLRELRELDERHQLILDPAEIYNVVIIATYNESLEIIEPAVQSIANSNYDLKRMILVIAYEERGGADIAHNASTLIDKFGKRFAYATAIKHPDGRPGEGRTKGANLTFASIELQRQLASWNLDPEKVIVTTLDADHQPSKDYFGYLTYTYCINPNRTRKSYQPIPMFYNNIWDVPAAMRVIATGNSFWMLMETMRPHRLRNFAAHAQSLQTLIDTDYWSLTSIVEDGHQYWRTYFAYGGDHKVVPLFVPVYQDAVLADTYIKTFQVQYLQLRRWAWGISDFAYVVREAIRNRQISWSEKLLQMWRLFEGHFSWATSSLILTFAAWLPLYLNRRFADELLAHELPIIASRVLNLAMVGLAVTVIISLISLPPRPARYRRSRFIVMVASWLLLPLTAIFFGAFAAIDAQTRLMFGRYLDFRVTDKSRR